MICDGKSMEKWMEKRANRRVGTVRKGVRRKERRNRELPAVFK